MVADVNKKVDPNIFILLIFPVDIKKLIRKIKIHIAQGLNPSKNPKIIETSGNEISFALIFPRIGNVKEVASSQGYSMTQSSSKISIHSFDKQYLILFSI